MLAAPHVTKRAIFLFARANLLFSRNLSDPGPFTYFDPTSHNYHIIRGNIMVFDASGIY
jgi:hypothetical protein